MPHKAQRQLARNTLRAVGHKASRITSQMKNSSLVFKVGFETVEKLVSPAKTFTLEKWSYYGDPLLDTIDEKLDNAIMAIEKATEESERRKEKISEEQQRQSYMLHWDTLKQKFINTRWFARVDEILLQNSVVKAVTNKVVRPAEVFFNTATEVFLTDGSNFEDFLECLRARMGPAWDERLVSPSKAFYTTSKTVKTLVGAGKFFGGALQLGKQKVNSAIDDIMERWDHVLSVTDGAVDNWLPERNNGELDADDSEDDFGDEASDIVPNTFADEVIFAMDYDIGVGPLAAASESEPDHRPEVSEDEDTVVEEQFISHDTNISPSEKMVNKRYRSVIPIAEKVSKRIRQRIPLVTELPVTLKAKLMQSEWFQKVDEILRQNAVIQMMQLQMMAALSQVVRPAEHFYNTAVESFRSNTKSSEGFVASLRGKMGSAWDERLTQPAIAFYQCASELTQQQQQNNNGQDNAASSLPEPSPSNP